MFIDVALFQKKDNKPYPDKKYCTENEVYR